jgi:hypothetical protein
MHEERELLRHFLAALAYRTQKALRSAPVEFGTFRAGDGARTPAELVRHMTSVLGYARTFFVGGQYRPDPLPSLKEETARLHEMIGDRARLAILRRLAGDPVAPENFVVADIDPARCGPEQAEPVALTRAGPKRPRVGCRSHDDET